MNQASELQGMTHVCALVDGVRKAMFSVDIIASALVGDCMSTARASYSRTSHSTSHNTELKLLTALERRLSEKRVEIARAKSGALIAAALVEMPHIDSMVWDVSAEPEFGDEGGTYTSLSVDIQEFTPSSGLDDDADNIQAWIDDCDDLRSALWPAISDAEEGSRRVAIERSKAAHLLQDEVIDGAAVFATITVITP